MSAGPGNAVGDPMARPMDISASYQNVGWRRFRMSLYEDPNFFWMRPLYADYRPLEKVERKTVRA